MNYWLIKSEPGTYSWSDLEHDKKTIWDGVRNYQARNNLQAMKKGDLALFYHSNEDKAVMGIAKISKEFSQDPTTDDSAWVVVEVQYFKKLRNPVTLAQVKQEKRLAQMVLVKNSRLSVQSVKEKEFDIILELSEK
jgi:predicted RNA-binding protein with PUA-like domain